MPPCGSASPSQPCLARVERLRRRGRVGRMGADRPRPAFFRTRFWPDPAPADVPGRDPGRGFSGDRVALPSVQAFFQPLSLLAFVLTVQNGSIAFALSDLIGHFAYGLYLAWRKRPHAQALGRVGPGRAPRHRPRWIGMPLYNLPGLSILGVRDLAAPDHAVHGPAGRLPGTWRWPSASSTFRHRSSRRPRRRSSSSSRPDERRETRVFGRKMLLALLVL